ncbi:MAG: multicomponent Na+:H+ antiporter subunit [Actinomycetota bacterium]|nr:multicomponent Na+:H+ antiporter subunit [Actinomycetota bacterium]
MTGRQESHDEHGRHRTWAAVALVAGMAVLLLLAVTDLPREAAPLPTVAREAMTSALPAWGSTEPVSVVVYGSRGFDTFGETFLLLAAVASVLLLTRRRERRAGFQGEEVAATRERSEQDPHPTSGRNEREARAAEREEEREDSDGPDASWSVPPRLPGLTVVVQGAARVLAPALAVAGLYLFAFGSSPGGGFPAGGVALGVLLLLYAAFGRHLVRQVTSAAGVEVVELAGAAVIVLIAVVGLVAEGSLTANWLPLTRPGGFRSGGILQPFSGAELVEVGTGLVLVTFALLDLRHDWADDTPEGPGREQ